MSASPNRSTSKDRRALKVIENYALGSAGAMVAIPIPGADFAATYAVWGKMIVEIGKVYGHRVSFEDAKALGADIFKSVILTSAAWYGSAKTASTVLKFFPGAGTVAGYLVDAVIAAYGARKITSALGFATAAYFKSDKELRPNSILDQIARVLKSPKTLPTLLAAVSAAKKKVSRAPKKA